MNTNLQLLMTKKNLILNDKFLLNVFFSSTGQNLIQLCFYISLTVKLQVNQGYSKPVGFKDVKLHQKNKNVDLFYD